MWHATVNATVRTHKPPRAMRHGGRTSRISPRPMLRPVTSTVVGSCDDSARCSGLHSPLANDRSSWLTSAYGCGTAPDLDRLPLDVGIACSVVDVSQPRWATRGPPPRRTSTLTFMSWTWSYESAEGHTASPAPTFPSQADAESWIGETWRELLEAGVDSVTLMEGDRIVYSGMSLHP